jgi:hypothetical protein
MKWLVATALTTTLVTGVFMFEAGIAQVALAAPASIQLAQNSSTSGMSGSTAQSRSTAQKESQGMPAAGTPDRTGQPGFQGNQPPNVTSSGPNANAPAPNTPAAAANSNSRSSTAATSTMNNNTTGTGGVVTNRSNSGAATGSSNRATGTSASRSGSMGQSDMSSGMTHATSGKSTHKSTARAKSSRRARSMGTASRGRDNNGDHATTALNWLSAQGYRDVKEIHQQGNMFVATVNKDGRSQQVTVDPASGRVSPAS